MGFRTQSGTEKAVGGLADSLVRRERKQRAGEPSVTLRPRSAGRAVGWRYACLGVLMPVCGLFLPIPMTILMFVWSVPSVVLGLSLATARACAGPAGMTYRYGRTTFVPAKNVRAIEVGTVSGLSSSRACLLVHRCEGPPLGLPALARPEKDGGRRAVEQQAALLRGVLQLANPSAPVRFTPVRPLG
jgi:hypothetical protein